MAVKGAAVIGDRLTRSGAYINTAASFTILQWVQVTYQPADTEANTFYFFGDDSYTDPYISLYAITTGTTINSALGVWDGTTGLDSAPYPLTIGLWYGFAIVVDQALGEVRLYVVTTVGGGAILLDTLVIDMSAAVFAVTGESLYGDGAGRPASGATTVGVFASALTPTQISAQFGSEMSLLTAQSYTPLLVPGTLTDSSGNGHGWTATGTPAQFRGPFGFPANTAATATVISSLPFTVANTFDGGSFSETWFVYTADADDLMLGMHLASTANNPNLDIFKTIALTATVPGYCDKTHPIQTPVTNGSAYYIQLTGETTGTATITITIHAQPNQTLISGQVWVPDPSRLAVFPPIVVDFTAEDVTRVVSLAGADQIDQLPDGTICLGEIPVSGAPSRVNQFILYNGSTLAVIGTVANPIAPALMFVKQDHVSAFYVAKSVFAGSPLKVYKINSNATLSGTNWTLPGATLAAFAVSVGGLIAYTSDFSVDTPIGAFDLVNNVALANFAAGVTGYKINSLTVLADDSVVATYQKTSDNSIRIIRYDSAGASQATFNAPAGQSFVGNTAPGADDPTSIVARTENTALTTSTFWHLWASDLSDGGHFTLDNFDDGEGHNSTSQFFGPSEASSFIVFKGSTPVPPFVNPTTTTINIRRMRRTPHLNQGHKRITFIRFELLAQVGEGLLQGQGVDPQAIFRWSDDGGRTWSQEHWTTLGKLGAYRTRVLWRRLGQARDRVFEVVVSDPVNVALITAYLDADVGTS